MTVGRVVMGNGCSGCGRVVALRAGRCSSCCGAAAAVACSKCGIVRPTQRRINATESWCGTCCNRHERVLEIAAVRVDLIVALARFGIDSDRAGVAFDTVVGARDVVLLRTALREDRDVFSGSSKAPRVIDRLVAALGPSAVSGPMSPRCWKCGTSQRLSGLTSGKRTCRGCVDIERAQPCVSCEVVVVHSKNAAKPVMCFECRVASRAASRTGRCERCGLDVPLVRRQHDPASRRCASCLELPMITCSVCGVQRRGNNGARSGRARCVNCAATRATCSVCHAPGRNVSAKWATGPVCGACRTRLLAQRATCAGCGQLRRIDPRNTNGELHCSTCARLEPLSVCRRCGIEDRIYRDRQCFACLLDIDLEDLVAKSPWLEPLRASLRASNAPRTVIRWMSGPAIKSTIEAIALNRESLSHATLDAVGSQPSVSHLRAVLVECGLLEARDEQTARLESFVAAQVRSIRRVEDRKLVEAFATWQVLRRHRQRVKRRENTRLRTDDGDARNDVIYAIRFLDWLHDENLPLAGCTQRDVDSWVVGAAARREVRDFVRWAVSRRLATGIDVRRPANSIPGRVMASEELTALVRRFLVDDTIRVADRVAGLFVMCFAQRMTRIAGLRRDDVESRDGHEWVQFGDTPIQLPESIGVLARELRDNTSGHATTGASAKSQWLFPGGRPGRPISAEALGGRLHRYGVRPNKARTTAMLDLAAELPPAVLGDMIGLFPNTAVKWVHAAGGDWTTYVANRTRDTEAQT